jgi:hypothetical protein
MAIVIRFIGEADSFLSSVDKAIKKTELFSKKSVTEFSKAAKAAAAWSAAAGTALAGIGVAMVNSSRQVIDEQAKLSRALGGTSAGMQALARAGGRAGVTTEELQAASQRLNQSLGEAMIKGGKAGETLAKLGLNAKDLAQMDIDQRMQAISRSMRDMGLSTQESAYHLRNLGIRQSSMITLMQEGGADLDESRRKIELYGAALSEVDAAKVEAANDAMAEIGIIWQGLSQQFTVQVAPVLTALSELLTGAAEKAGGMDKAAERGFNAIIKGASFAINAVDGVKRVFEVTGAGIIAFYAEILANISTRIQNFINTINKIPGINISTDGIDRFVAHSVGVAREARADIDDILTRPMAGTIFEQLVIDAQDAAQKAAEATVEARKSFERIFSDGPEEEEKQGKGDKGRDQMAGRLQAIKDSFLAEEELRTVQYARQMEQLREFKDAELITIQEYEELIKMSNQQFMDDVSAIRLRGMSEHERIMALSMAAQSAMVIGELGNMFSAYSAHSKKMNKAAQIAGATSALISTFQGQAEALKLGWPMGVIAAAKIGAAGLGFVSAIKGAGSGGSGGGAGSAASSTAISAPPAQRFDVSLSGFNPNQAMGMNQMGGVMDFINTRIRAGETFGGFSY